MAAWVLVPEVIPEKAIEEAGTPVMAVQVMAPVESIPVMVVVAEQPPSKKFVASLSSRLVSSISPLTSNLLEGVFVPTPTLPPLKRAAYVVSLTLAVVTSTSRPTLVDAPVPASVNLIRSPLIVLVRFEDSVMERERPYSVLAETEGLLVTLWVDPIWVPPAEGANVSVRLNGAWVVPEKVWE